MTHTKTFTREDGSRVGIELQAYIGIDDNLSFYEKIWRYSAAGNLIKTTKSTHPTPAEIHATKLELWEKLKPTICE